MKAQANRCLAKSHSLADPWITNNPSHVILSYFTSTIQHDSKGNETELDTTEKSKHTDI